MWFTVHAARRKTGGLGRPSIGTSRAAIILTLTKQSLGNIGFQVELTTAPGPRHNNDMLTGRSPTPLVVAPQWGCT